MALGKLTDAVIVAICCTPAPSVAVQGEGYVSLFHAKRRSGWSSHVVNSQPRGGGNRDLAVLAQVMDSGSAPLVREGRWE